MNDRYLGNVNWEECFTKEREPHSHLPVLSGLQHRGAAHTRGFRIGKDGNNTVTDDKWLDQR